MLRPKAMNFWELCHHEVSTTKGRSRPGKLAVSQIIGIAAESKSAHRAENEAGNCSVTSVDSIRT